MKIKEYIRIILVTCTLIFTFVQVAMGFAFILPLVNVGIDLLGAALESVYFKQAVVLGASAALWLMNQAGSGTSSNPNYTDAQGNVFTPEQVVWVQNVSGVPTVAAGNATGKLSLQQMQANVTTGTTPTLYNAVMKPGASLQPTLSDAQGGTALNTVVKGSDGNYYKINGAGYAKYSNVCGSACNGTGWLVINSSVIEANFQNSGGGSYCCNTGCYYAVTATSVPPYVPRTGVDASNQLAPGSNLTGNNTAAMGTSFSGDIDRLIKSNPNIVQDTDGSTATGPTNPPLIYPTPMTTTQIQNQLGAVPLPGASGGNGAPGSGQSFNQGGPYGSNASAANGGTGSPTTTPGSGSSSAGGGTTNGSGFSNLTGSKNGSTGTINPVTGTFDGTLTPPTQNNIQTLWDNFIASSPLATLITGSMSMTLTGESCSMSQAIGGSIGNLSISFCNLQSSIQNFGLIILAFCHLYCIFLLFGG